MANGNGHSNGNGKGVLGKTALQGGNMLAAEVAGATVELGVINSIDSLEKAAPGVVSGFKTFLKNAIVKPFQAPIEWCLNHTKSIEGREGYEKRTHQTPEERLEALTDSTYRYGAAVATGYGAMWYTQKGLNALSGVPMSAGHTTKVYIQDAVVHVGAVGLLGAPFMEGFTTKLKEGMKCVFRTLGFNEEQAERNAILGTTVQLPNGLAWALDVLTLHNMNKTEAAKALSHARF